MGNKKKTKIFLAISLYFSFISAVQAEPVQCKGIKPLQNPKQAQQCAQEIVANKLEKVFEYGHIQPHLGDLNQCTGHTHKKSYFSDQVGEFKASFGPVISCDTDEIHDTWQCSISPGQKETCLVPKTGAKGKLQHNVSCFAINDKGILITVYPHHCASQ